ncbi:IucA/IucC family C-terminal-domain containing protein [Alkalihalobacillus sp. AL-G]|uniref:IucA/IucC family C-terminal-domain containing protein n=1 Tax=Alkalihalobacillus sp. AL-G TaxID=2926399 RepID=UPI00272CF194|nr:IucA/IucC family C-terminal-domain containing protein [Alkalihalobacillus sp. AL-G]WLD94156.1 (2Fe-2S)-binding protein [Alkalihalobacillus sp. AL-G]
MQYVPLTPKHEAFLAEHCRLSLEKSSGDFSVTSVDLLQEHTVESYITEMTQLIQSPNKLVTASQISKKYAFLMVTPFFASFSLFNLNLNVQSDNCIIVPKKSDGNLLPELSLKSLEAKPFETDRRTEMEAGLEQLFRNHISLVWDNLAKVCNSPLPVLWENTATYIYWLYETALLQHADDPLKEGIKKDFKYILEAPGECFGLNHNPFKKYYFEKQQLLKSDPEIRIRKTCCLYYEISPDRTFCNNCPRCLSGYVPQPKKID